ncbi:excisionase [Bradyrhizobium macuxiense]|uniref:Excisionase n=1 Tax=Bradyrhizobium macuxiense TaxID=1755647 RepID=A0A109JBJ6_9BRAD|nr:excisionase [Bradyrhizobium macuxiense]
MTIPEFCRWARLGKTAVYREIKSRRLVLRKAGAKSLILMSDAEAWLRSLPTASAA